MIDKLASSPRRRPATCLRAGAALAAVLAAAPALAQTVPVPTDDATPATEVVVTAQKRTQRLIDVPVPVSSVSSDALIEQNLVRLSDFYNRIPGLQYAGGRTTNLSIRGITTGGTTAPTVAILVDDIPFGGSTVAGQPVIPDFDPATLERIEVLRGPQGTLYGASSLGGLIKYVTRTPDTNRWSGRLEVGGNSVNGGNEGYSARGSANAPIVRDTVALNLSGFYRQDPRWIDNIYPGAPTTDVNKKETWGGRAALLVKPTSTLRITLAALHQQVNTANSDLAITSGGIRICPECGTTASVGNTAATSFRSVNGSLTTLNVLPSTGNQTFNLYSGRGELDLGFARLTTITAWSEIDNTLFNDVTSTFSRLFFPVYGSPSTATVSIINADKTRKFSQEVRLGGVGRTFDWTVGGFYTVEHSQTAQTLSLSSPAVIPYVGAGPARYREYAGFADLTYHATDRLDLQVGGRYAANDQRSLTVTTIDPTVVRFFGASGQASYASSDHAFTWLVSPSYRLSKDMLVYARIASGYRPGGPNTASSLTIPKSYGSDRVVNYEVGFKGVVVPRVLTLDVSLFQIDWRDIQLQNTDAVSQLTFFTNGGKARSRGIEGAAQLRPWTGFSLDANATFNSAVLTQNLPIGATFTGLAGRDGDRLPFTAKFTSSISARQTFDLTARTDVFVGATYTYVGSRWSAFNTTAATATRPRFQLPAYGLIDLQAGLSVDKVWHANVYLRNVTDKLGVITAQNRNGTSVPTAIFTQPRTVGLILARDF